MKIILGMLTLIIGLGFLSKVTPEITGPVDIQSDSLRHLDVTCFMPNEAPEPPSLVQIVGVPEKEPFLSYPDSILLSMADTTFRLAVEADDTMESCPKIEIDYRRSHVIQARSWPIGQYETKFGWWYANIVTAPKGSE